MSLRSEFVVLARAPGANVSELCCRFGISRKTGYKWLSRETLDDRSRRPAQSPRRTQQAMEAVLLAARDEFPDWGARKLKRYLQDRGQDGLPAVSTITAILRRHGRISPEATEAAQHWQRFEHPQPNALWQMDFKGHIALSQGRCHPLTVLDDHSRFNVVLHACVGETLQDVQGPLEGAFRRYGLPDRISCDNGPPWGTMHREDRLTRLGVWLIRLGIRLTHARPKHPQTNGKDERFHRTLKAGLLSRRTLSDQDDAQRAFDRFRTIYNEVRPHQALDLAVPASRYRVSPRAYPEALAPIEYDPALLLRKVDCDGFISFHRRWVRVSEALKGQTVALQPSPDQEGLHTIYFCHHPVRTVDLRNPESTD
jgi:transposase InsO family protein